MVTRVLVADDHPIVREGLRSLIMRQADLVWAGEAADGRALIEAVPQLAPDVVLLDLRMPNGGGLAALRHRGALRPRWIVLSSYTDADQVLAAVEAGADGYLLKGSDYSSILDAIRAVARGERVISPGLIGTLFDTLARQAEDRIVRESGLDSVALRVLTAIAEGATTAEIGGRLHMSEVTAKRHIQEIVERLGVRNRTQAVAEALRRGWIT
jgi:DNA-binding NarL/FixJ family response regulator